MCMGLFPSELGALRVLRCRASEMWSAFQRDMTAAVGECPGTRDPQRLRNSWVRKALSARAVGMCACTALHAQACPCVHEA